MEHETYIAERIVNLKEYEMTASDVFWAIDDLRREMEKESPSPARVNGLLRAAHHMALVFKDFDVVTETRRVRAVKESP